MRAASAAALCLLLSLSAANGQTGPDTAQPDAIGASLSEILAFATLGSVDPQPRSAQVTRDGADYLVRLPLKGFASPDDAAVNAVARPLDGGLWDIESMTFPLAGTVETVTAQGGTSRIAYSIGEQSIHVRIDPALARPSSFAANLGTIVLRSDSGGQHNEQRFDRYVMDGTLSVDANGKLNLVSRGTATNWRLTGRGRNGFETDTLVRKLYGHASVQDLDKIQGARFLVAARALMAAAAPPGRASPGQAPPGQASPGQVGSQSAGQREDVRTLIDAVDGLLTKFDVEQTLDGISFRIGPASSGTAGRIHADLNGSTADGQLNARMDVAVDELAVAGVPPDTAPYVPRHIELRSAVARVPSGRLMALLRAAAGQNLDPVALQAGLSSLLADPNAVAGIESVAFDSGPLRLTGSVRMVPRANGELGANIHVSATGVDVLIAQAQGNPALQQALPVLFMAKGMGRQDGAATVWDIAVGGGAVTINGTPFGQPAGRTR